MPYRAVSPLVMATPAAPHTWRPGTNNPTPLGGRDEQQRKPPRRRAVPCPTLAEALPQRRRPPTPAAVRFKIQNAAEEAAQVAAYVDARLVFDRRDHVCGERWSAALDELPEALIPAGLRPRRPAALQTTAPHALPTDRLRVGPRGRGRGRGPPRPRSAICGSRGLRRPRPPTRRSTRAHRRQHRLLHR
jgi:hypothetical protein